MRSSSRFWSLFDRLLEYTVWCSAAILIFMMMSITVDVLRRYFLHEAFVWTTQISEYGLVYITFLGAAWLLKKEGHVHMETVIEMLSKRGQAFLGIISSIVGMVVAFFFTWYGMTVAVDHLRRGIYEPTILQLPVGYVLVIIPIGSLLLLIQFIRRTYAFSRLFVTGETYRWHEYLVEELPEKDR